MKVLAATNNAHKIREMEQILSQTGIELVTPKSIGLSLEVVEDGNTFEENARKKAQEFSQASGMVALADDSGLTVNCLGGAPGVYSARYGGEGVLDDAGRVQLLLKNMRGKEDRSAAFVCAIALVFTDGTLIEVKAECRGKIAEQPAGEGGFGYDPVFVPEGFDRTFSQLTAEKKNAISHRGKALEKLRDCIGGRL